eukprot:29919-Pelagococcus_subviridis.AAC.1
MSGRDGRHVSGKDTERAVERECREDAPSVIRADVDRRGAFLDDVEQRLEDVFVPHLAALQHRGAHELVVPRDGQRALLRDGADARRGECRGGVQRRQTELKGVEGGD